MKTTIFLCALVAVLAFVFGMRHQQQAQGSRSVDINFDRSARLSSISCGYRVRMSNATYILTRNIVTSNEFLGLEYDISFKLIVQPE